MSFFMLAKWDLKGIICCDVFNKHGSPGSFPFPWISQIGPILKSRKLWCRSSNCRISRHGQPIFGKNREIIFLCSRFFLWLWLKKKKVCYLLLLFYWSEIRRCAWRKSFWFGTLTLARATDCRSDKKLCKNDRAIILSKFPRAFFS